MAGLRFETSQRLEIDALLRAHERAAESFAEFNPFAASGRSYGEFKTKGTFPDLNASEGVRFPTFYIAAQIPKKASSIETARKILTDAEPDVVDLAKVSVSCSVEEAQSSQTNKNADSVGFHVARGFGFFQYSVRGSKAGGDVDYRADLFASFAERLALPVSINRDSGSFTVASTADEPRGNRPPRPNPTNFIARLPDANLARIVQLLDLYFEHFRPKQQFGWSWTVENPDDPQDADRGRKTYEAVGRAQFPADRIDFNCSYELSALEGVDVLRSLVTGKSGFSTRFGLVQFDDGYSRELTVETDADGHRLTVELRSQDYLQELEEKLGVEFRETP